MNHSDLIYVNHSKCRKQSSLGHNKFNVSFLASPKFIRVLSNLESCVYIGNETHNMSDFTTNFFCRNCCSLEHLSNFCQATPKCVKCTENHHENECELLMPKRKPVQTALNQDSAQMNSKSAKHT